MTILKTEEEIEIMAEGGKKLAKILIALEKEVVVGLETRELDCIARELITAEGGTAAFLGYRPYGAGKAFPAALCVSVNDEVVHGLPSDYAMKDGDLVKLDAGMIYKGFYTDTALTVMVGKVSRAARELVEVTRQSLEKGIDAARHGNALGDIGHAIESHVKSFGFDVVTALTGHGIGRALHEDPYVMNFGKSGAGEKLKIGMVLAIEPMVAARSGRVRQREDDSFIVADGSLAAHFEHTIAITKEGPRILTML